MRAVSTDPLQAAHAFPSRTQDRAVELQRGPPMWYLIIGCDAPDTLEKRLAARADHLARLRILLAEGRLKLAGPLPATDSEDPGPAGFVGSAIVAEFADFNAARDWAAADPYFEAGVYESVQVLPFKPVLP